MSTGIPREKGTVLLCSRCHAFLGRAVPAVVHIRVEGRQHAWSLAEGQEPVGDFDADCPNCGRGTVSWAYVDRVAREGRRAAQVTLRRVYAE